MSGNGGADVQRLRSLSHFIRAPAALPWIAGMIPLRSLRNAVAGVRASVCAAYRT
jgi:hypothetical protein